MSTRQLQFLSTPPPPSAVSSTTTTTTVNSANNNSTPNSQTPTNHLLAPSTFSDGQPLPGLVVFDLDYTLWPFWIDTHATPPLKPATKDASRVVDRAGESFAPYPAVAAVLHAAHRAGLVLALASRTSAPDLATQLLKMLHVPAPQHTMGDGPMGGLGGGGSGSFASGATAMTPPRSASSSTSNLAPAFGLAASSATPAMTPSPTKALFAPPAAARAKAPPKRMFDFFRHHQIFPADKRRHFERLVKQSHVRAEDMLFFDDEKRNKNVEEMGVTFWLVRDGVTRDEVDAGVREWRRRKGLGQGG